MVFRQGKGCTTLKGAYKRLDYLGFNNGVNPLHGGFKTLVHAMTHADGSTEFYPVILWREGSQLNIPYLCSKGIWVIGA